jgi:hypothetical protein
LSTKALAGRSDSESAHRLQLRLKVSLQYSLGARDRREQVEFYRFHMYRFILLVNKCWRFIPITSICRQLSMNLLHLLYLLLSK